MRRNTRQWWIIASLAVLLALGGCKKRTEAPPPPAATPPPPTAPTASISASPTSIQRGQAATLTWQTTDADSAVISGIGSVAPSGSQAVTPETSTTYSLTAKGPGGEASDSVRITVAEPTAAGPSESEVELFARNVQDVYFDYDRSDIRPDGQRTLEAGARFLAQHPGIRFVVEGHCDERGSTEYNLALGDRRANAVREALIRLGVSADRIRTISFGKEKPFCTQSNEVCWQQNRRGHFVYQR
ncbi:MAG TPA: peptidoglycan-associated lipoprotein Pal [Terriglobales bacterium]|nr:peptidoglycan-associated lipoprotein Pal [Terriglobales bacterium]